MKPLNSYDKKGILAEEVFVEIFEQEDAIRRAQMLLSFQDRAKELGVKGQFDTMVKAFEKAEKETQQKQRQSQTLIENWTNFTGKYDSMKCGSWLQDLTFAVDKDDEIIEDEFNIDPHTLSAIWYALDDYEVSDLKGGGLRTLGTR